MNQKLFPILVASLFITGLQAQGTPSRFGVAFGMASPQDLHASNGLSLGLNVYFNQGAMAEGRIRFEAVNFGAKTETTSTTVLESKGNAVTVSFDWMPGNTRVHAILGLGAMSWSQELQQQDVLGGSPSFRTYGGNQTGFSIVPTLGIQVRINQYFCLEGRYAFATNISKKSGYRLTNNVGDSIPEMNYFTLGMEFRFPRLH